MLAKDTQFKNIELVREFPNAGLKTMNLSAQTIHPLTDIPNLILLAIEDISSRKTLENERALLLKDTQEAKAEAEAANRTKDLFLATLSHELRTPLTSLILQTQLLRRSGTDKAKIDHAALRIEQAAKTQAQLIEDLLDISRIVTGKLKMEQQLVDLSKVIEQAKETVSATAAEKSVAVELDLQPVGQISGDPVRMQQVVWNLLSNAIKFSPKNAKVLIKLFTHDGLAQIQVIDQGSGIEAEFLPQVFKRFSQAEDSMTRTHGGLGLGMAIVRHIVEMHGGSVNVESLGKDKGATFTISLPLVAASSQGKGNSGGSANGTRFLKPGHLAKLNGLRILVVDDDPGTREALGELLTQTGAEVRTAASAREGMQVFHEFKPQELICDIAMPVEDGYTFISKIRKLEDGSNIPALALTALASEKDREKAFTAGFQMHLAKPVDFNRLTEALVELGEGS